LRGRLLFILTLLLLAAPAPPALAHPEGFSGFRFLIRQDKATAIITLHARDLGTWFPPATRLNYAEDVCREIIEKPDDLLEIHFDDAPAPIAPTAKRAFTPETGMIQVELTYPIVRMPSTVTVWSKLLVRMPRGHQQLFFAEDLRGRPPDAESGSAITEATLSIEEDNTTFAIPRADPAGSPLAQSPSSSTPTSQHSLASSRKDSSHPPRRISFFLLGIEHILTGYDHLLFLAALLLVSRSFKEAAAVVTFFTVAHSITLTLAALDIVRLPARIVEPAIAASILYIGVENLLGQHRYAIQKRAAITFLFGLVHGLGFAGALHEASLGSTATGLALPLLKFSIGLETGQLTLAALALTLLLRLRRNHRAEPKWVPACSLLIALTGAFWLIQRVAAG
jgi:hydrogenase/urease accessory protein HupE